MNTLFLHTLLWSFIAYPELFIQTISSKKINNFTVTEHHAPCSQEAWNCANQYFTNAFTFVALANAPGANNFIRPNRR